MVKCIREKEKKTISRFIIAQQHMSTKKKAHFHLVIVTRKKIQKTC